MGCDLRLKKSETLRQLDEDFTATRSHLWKSFEANENSLYEKLSEPFYLSAENKRKKLKGSEDQYTDRDSQSILQSFYCQTLETEALKKFGACILYTSPSPRDYGESRMPSSA